MVQRIINNILGRKLTIDEKMRLDPYDYEHFDPVLYRQIVTKYRKGK